MNGTISATQHATVIEPAAVQSGQPDRHTRVRLEQANALYGMAEMKHEFRTAVFKRRTETRNGSNRLIKSDKPGRLCRLTAFFTQQQLCHKRPCQAP